MNHETQLDLPLARSKEFGLLLKLIFYTFLKLSLDFNVLLTKEIGLDSISRYRIAGRKDFSNS